MPKNIYNIYAQCVPSVIKNNLRIILLIFVGWALLVFSIAYFAANELHGISSYETKAVIQGNNLPEVPAPSAITNLNRWDSGWFLEIAINGYHPRDAGTEVLNQQQGKTAFFPLYPSLIRLGIKTGFNPVVFGIGLNILFSFGAALLVFLLAYEWLKNEKHALRAMTLFLFFPSSFFLLSLYSEALFCFLSFAAFYLALKRRWLFANILVALCTATRSPGLFVGLTIFFIYLQDKNFNWRKIDRNILTFLIAPLGLVVYSLYLWLQFGDPLRMFHSQQYWKQQLHPNILATIWDQIVAVAKNFLTSGYNNFGGDYGKEWINYLTTGSWLLGLVVAISLWRDKIARPFMLYMLINLLYFLSKGNFISVNRYILPLFPIYIILAKSMRKSESTYTVVLVTFSCLMTFGLVQFAISYWAG